MPENPRYGKEIVNPETHHETSDVNVRALIWFAVIVVVFAAVAHVALGLLFKAYVKIERNRNTDQMTGIKRTPEMSVPANQPLLQPFPRELPDKQVIPPYRSTPVTDLAELRASEDRALHSYGWVDRQKGIVRMPIDVAMKLTLQRGLPVQNTQTTPQTNIPNPGAHP
jgi:hypothetical protein